MRGLSCLSAAALEQCLRLLAPVLAEVFHQEIDDRPQVTALFDIDLEQVAHVVEARRGRPEIALLLDRGRLGVALNDEKTAQRRAIFARHFLPGRLALVAAEGNRPALDLRREQDAPAIVRHAHVPELGPAARVDADGGAQIDLRLLKTLRTHVVPPVEIVGPPRLERALELLVGGEVDIVGNDVVQFDFDEAIRTDRAGVFGQRFDGAHVSFPSAAARAGRRAFPAWIIAYSCTHAMHVHAPLRGLRSKRLVASDSRTSRPCWLKTRHRHLRMPRSRLAAGLPRSPAPPP